MACKNRMLLENPKQPIPRTCPECGIFSCKYGIGEAGKINGDIPSDILSIAEKVRVRILGCGTAETVMLIANAINDERHRSAWQTIETAPKNGSRVLLYVPKEITDKNLASYEVFEACYVGGYESGDLWFSHGVPVYGATYWMETPIP